MRRATASAPLVLGGLIGLGAVLRLYGLAHQGYWYDEATTALLVRFSPGRMLGLIPQTESTPPLYYCIAWVWSRLFGDAEAGVRSLSAIAGICVVPVAYGATARLISRRAALIAAALTACNPLLIWYSQEARSYELLVLLTGLALLAFAYALSTPAPRQLALWSLACALSLATHYFAVLAIVPQAAWLAIKHRRSRAVRLAVGAVAACAAALIPLALSQNGTGHDRWIAAAPLLPRLAQMLPQLLIGTGSPVRTAVKLAAMAAVAVALLLLVTRSQPSERHAAARLGALALAGFVLALALAAGGFDELITRNLVALWLPAAMFVAGGLAAAAAPRLGTSATIVLCAIGVFATVGIAADSSLQRPDWRPVARALGPAPTGDAGRAILIQHYRYRLPLSLYLPRLQVMRSPARVLGMDVISIASPSQPLCWWGAACNLIPSRMQSTYRLPGLRFASQQRVAQFTIRRLAAAAPVLLTRRAVDSALTATRLRHDVLLLQRPAAPAPRTR